MDRSHFHHLISLCRPAKTVKNLLNKREIEMRIFVTGATGWIGAAVVRELIEEGHQVLGLARSETSARSLIAAGAEVHRGSLSDLESLRKGASATDGVMHLAFINKLSQATIGGRLKILLGGHPGRIFARFAAVVTEADKAAIDAIGAALATSGRPLVVAFPTMALKAGRLAKEDDAADPASVGSARVPSETAVMAWASRGVRASVVRLPPSVHGDGDTGLVPALIGMARKGKAVAYVGDGLNHWPAVHRNDAAHLFRLALEKGAAGAIYHAVADEGVPFRDIVEVIGRRLNIPVASMSPQQAAGLYSWLAPFAATDNLVSSEQTREQLGWQPSRPGLIADLDRPRYFKT